MIRQVLGILIGIVVCGLVVGLIEALNLRLYPAPPGIDFHDPTQVAAYVAKLPAAAFAIVLAAWTLGSFAGGWVAASISRHWPRACALGVAAFMLAGVAYNVIVLPHPLWMAALGLLLPAPAALLGARVAIRPAP